LKHVAPKPTFILTLNGCVHLSYAFIVI